MLPHGFPGLNGIVGFTTGRGANAATQVLPVESGFMPVGQQTPHDVA
jgi:hypothetical protein